MSPQEIYQQAIQAGFNPQAAVTMTAIALAESSGNPSVVSAPNRNGTVDRGLWQINSVHSQYDPNRLVTDPGYNARAAYQLSGGGRNFKPWSTYNNGRYQKFMSIADFAGRQVPAQAQASGGMAGMVQPAGTTTGGAQPGQPPDVGGMLREAAGIVGGSGPSGDLGGMLQSTVGQDMKAAAGTDQTTGTTTDTTGQPAAAGKPGGGGILSPVSNGAAGTAVSTAVKAAQNNTPYVWGGNSLTKGVDCSGLIQQAYKTAGINLPRVSDAQINSGQKVDPSQMQPGDLLGWAYNSGLGGGATHVAMYIGGGKMVEALHKGEPVHVVDVRKPQFVTRVAGGGGGSPAPTDTGTSGTQQQPQNNPDDNLWSRLAAMSNAMSASWGKGESV